MTRHEDDSYGEESRHIIEGLRRLAEAIETPPDLLPNILVRGAQLLPRRQPVLVKWCRAVGFWLSRPWVWAPAMAMACFAAGVAVSPAPFYPASGIGASYDARALSEAPVPRQTSLRREEARTQQTLPPARPEERTGIRRREEAKMMASAARATVARETLQARIRPQAAAPTPGVSVTVTLPAELVTRLQQKAQQRPADIASLVREAVEAYVGALPE